MSKRIISLILISLMMLSFCGCSSIYKKEVLSVTDYTDEAHKDLHGDVPDISDYDQLKAAITTMVNGHVADQKFKFTGYSDKLQSDLSQAGWEVRAESALGSYAVDYMSYDLNRIVTYYEATFHITYKRTEAEIADIGYISGASKLAGAIEPALERQQPSLALRLTSSSISEEAVLAAVAAAYSQNPLSCVLAPTAQVSIHPASGMHRIIEIRFNYGAGAAELKELKTALSNKISASTEKVSAANPSHAALTLLNTISGSCTYDPDGSLRGAKPDLNPAFGISAYGALVEGLADSQGIAMAYSALCRELGIPCLVVSGSYDKLPHWWNIIKLADTYYHVDVSAAATLGSDASFMLTDEQMQGSYWWNIEDYPACGSFSGVVKPPLGN